LDVALVLHERSRFGRESGAPLFALGCLGDRLARGLGAADPTAPRDFIELAETVASQPQ
jgi:hypothetical protein